MSDNDTLIPSDTFDEGAFPGPSQPHDRHDHSFLIVPNVHLSVGS